MSETVINRPAKIKAHNTVKGKGLTIERIYTTKAYTHTTKLNGNVAM